MRCKVPTASLTALHVQRSPSLLLPIPADKKEKFDELVEDHGVKILIDAKALMHVLGTKMDYVEDRLRCAALC